MTRTTRAPVDVSSALGDVGTDAMTAMPVAMRSADRMPATLKIRVGGRVVRYAASATPRRAAERRGELSEHR